MRVSRRLSTMQIPGFVQALPALPPEKFRAVLCVALRPIRPLFEQPLCSPHIDADPSAEPTFSGLRAICRPVCAILFWQRKEGASSLKVSACQTSSAPTLELVPCSSVCLHASSVLHDYPTLIPTFVWGSAAHAGSPVCHAPLLPPRCQDASFWGRRRGQRESGGSGTFRRAPVVTRSLWSYARS